MNKLNLIAISGSLRRASTNTTLLQAAIAIAPESISLKLWDGVSGLPHFNPDTEDSNLPGEVATFRDIMGQCDGLVIACPEYARGIPGAFKNALDWLVSSESFFNKPVCLLNASPRATDAQNALRLVLQTMSAQIVEPACITVPLLGKNVPPEEILADELVCHQLCSALQSLTDFINAQYR